MSKNVPQRFRASIDGKRPARWFRRELSFVVTTTGEYDAGPVPLTIVAASLEAGAGASGESEAGRPPYLFYVRTQKRGPRYRVIRQMPPPDQYEELGRRSSYDGPPLNSDGINIGHLLFLAPRAFLALNERFLDVDPTSDSTRRGRRITQAILVVEYRYSVMTNQGVWVDYLFAMPYDKRADLVAQLRAHSAEPVIMMWRGEGDDASIVGPLASNAGDFMRELRSVYAVLAESLADRIECVLPQMLHKHNS